MQAHKLTATLVAAVAAAVLAVAAMPSQAQTPAETTTVKRKPTQVAVAGRPPARVTVRKRSYLDPGTETKTHAEHYTDYAFPPNNGGPMTNSTLFNFPTSNRMPFPNCFDLPGFCR
jgi:hypothetical protein